MIVKKENNHQNGQGKLPGKSIQSSSIENNPTNVSIVAPIPAN